MTRPRRCSTSGPTTTPGSLGAPRRIGGRAARLVRASIRDHMRAAAPASERLATLVFGGFVMVAIGVTAFSGFQLAAADTIGDVPAEVTQTLSVLYSDFFLPFAAGVLVLFLAVGTAIVRYRTLPTWLGWGAFLIVIGFIVFFRGWRHSGRDLDRGGLDPALSGLDAGRRGRPRLSALAVKRQLDDPLAQAARMTARGLGRHRQQRRVGEARDRVRPRAPAGRRRRGSCRRGRSRRSRARPRSAARRRGPGPRPRRGRPDRRTRCARSRSGPRS